MNRITQVVRLQLLNKFTFIWLPLIILGATLVASIAIFSLLPLDSTKYGGGAQAPMWYFFAVGITSLTMTFPFSQALSITRREFFIGTLLTAVLTATVLTAVFVLGGWAEQATSGWGINGYFFYLDWIWTQGPAVAAATIFLLTMLLFTAGFTIGVLYKRFGPTLLTVVLVSFALALVACGWLIGRLNAWAAVFGWLAEQGPGGLALGLLVAFLAIATLGYGALRRAIP